MHKCNLFPIYILFQNKNVKNGQNHMDYTMNTSLLSPSVRVCRGEREWYIYMLFIDC